MKKINLSSRRITAAMAHSSRSDNDSEVTNMMMDARYLRQSSSLIQDALQKGFDVLQLANGDIVMTGTKTVVYQYAWDEEKGKLVKAKPKREPKKLTAPSMGDDDEVEAEEEA